MLRNGKYWSDEDKVALENAWAILDLTAIALNVLSRMPAPVGQVCGPISTGGYGNTKQNLHVFDQTIGRLINDGKTIFDQVPFEDPMQKMKVRGLSGEDLLLEFYLPIFESQVVNRLFFIHGWESSKGAVWEHEQGLARGMDIVYLDKDFLR